MEVSEPVPCLDEVSWAKRPGTALETRVSSNLLELLLEKKRRIDMHLAINLLNKEGRNRDERKMPLYDMICRGRRVGVLSCIYLVFDVTTQEIV